MLGQANWSLASAVQILTFNFGKKANKHIFQNDKNCSFYDGVSSEETSPFLAWKSLLNNFVVTSN